MKIDSAGNLYCCGPGGIHVFAPDAICLGVIKVPEYTANFCWGDGDLQKPVHHRLDVDLPHPRRRSRHAADELGR